MSEHASVATHEVRFKDAYPLPSSENRTCQTGTRWRAEFDAGNSDRVYLCDACVRQLRGGGKIW